VRLGTVGSLQALEKLGDSLTEGLDVVIYEPDEFEANAKLTWSNEGCWAAMIQGPLRYVDGTERPWVW
jgi:hypothetical protein